MHEDYDLEVRILSKYGVVYNIQEILLLYRVHPNQLTYKLQSFSEENIQLRNDIIENAKKIT